jgi:hypothetical protein
MKKRAKDLSADEIAVKLVKQLDGISIEDARKALDRAATLLSTTQVVSSESPLLK